MSEFNILASSGNTIIFHGEISFENAPTAYDLVSDKIATLTSVTLDLKELNQSDSSGLAVIIGCVRQAASQEKDIQIINPPKFLHELSRVFGVDQILPFRLN